MAAKPRIDSLKPGTAVALRFDNRDEVEPALFIRIEGTGDNRVAMFAQVTEDADAPRMYEWGAYRYSGRWAYGSGAQPLALAEILAVPA